MRCEAVHDRPHPPQAPNRARALAHIGASGTDCTRRGAAVVSGPADLGINLALAGARWCS
jgi:hypothetical protein